MIRAPMSERAILLGPQRHAPTVRSAVDSLTGSKRATVALVSAGWEEREAEDGEFREHLQHPMVNLAIWARIERIFERDEELLAAVRERHDTLRSLQDLYRLRLDGLMDSAAALLNNTGDPALLAPERESAIEMLRLLDRRHTERVETIHRQFEERWRPCERESIAVQRREIAELAGGADCLCVAGGHVGVLLHRLQLFDVLDLWGDRPVIAWSAGAMVLSEQLVLFHQEHGQAARTEVKEAGLGLLPGIVPLPHARKRLDLRDECSMQLLARRFAPALCVPLDEGQRIDWDGSRWSAPGGTMQLTVDGNLVEVTS